MFPMFVSKPGWDKDHQHILLFFRETRQHMFSFIIMQHSMFSSSEYKFFIYLGHMLAKHNKVPLGVQYYQCQQCNYRTVFKRKMEGHEQTHSGY